MLGAVSAPSESSRLLSNSQLEPGTILGSSVHLTGIVALVWGSLTSIKWSGHAITLLLKASLPTNIPDRTDYASASIVAKELKYTFRLILRPLSAVEAHQDGLKCLDEERKQLLELVGKTITVDCSGMRVDNVEQKGTGISVDLEGLGERMIISKAGPFKILAGEYILGDG